MTTGNAINELRNDISKYPIMNIQVWRTFVRVQMMNGDVKDFEDSTPGYEILEWFENNLERVEE